MVGIGILYTVSLPFVVGIGILYTVSLPFVVGSFCGW
jgi:hypothetical protein